MRKSWLFAAFLSVAGMAGAQEAGLRDLRTGDDIRGWRTVGKLILGQRGFCTGVLIAPDQVLTAAHCLYDKETGARISTDLIRFQSGWRDGRAEAYRNIRFAVAHPEYVISGEGDLNRVGFDLALLELDLPIDLPQLLPFEIGDALEPQDVVSVVSYAHDRADRPAIEKDCAVITKYPSVYVFDCNIDFGSSGAPVFRMTPGGAKVVSVISAKADLRGDKVALGVPLDQELADLHALLERNQQAHRGAAGVKIRSGGSADRAAKFIVP